MILSPQTRISPDGLGLPVALGGSTAAPSEFLQKTLDSLAAHIAILDEEGVVIAINSAWKHFAELNGYRGQAYGLGSNYLTICEAATGTNSEEAPEVLYGLRSVINGQEDEFYYEYPCHSPNEKRWFALRATRFWGEDEGAPTRVVIAHENITARKEVELLLREETRIIETLYRVGQIVSGELDVTKISASIVEAAMELCDSQLGLFLPYDLDLCAPMLCDAREKLPNGVARTTAFTRHEMGAPDQYLGDLKIVRLEDARLEDEVITPFCTNDFESWATASYLAATVTSRSGQNLGALFLAHNEPQKFARGCERIVVGLASQAALAFENALLYEAARREKEAATQSENRARFVTESIAHMVWINDRDGQLQYYNQKWFEYTGLSEKESYANGWPAVLHPDDLARTWERWRHSLKTGEIYEIEYRLRSKDGSFRWFLGRALPQRDSNGQILNWFGTCTDINDAKVNEAERNAALENEAAARREAETANRIKDEFLAVVSHELRTPLTPILGWMELLRGEEPELELRAQAYEVIERNARAQSQIVNDLLDVSRIITGKLKLNLRPIDLVCVINSALETVETAARAKGVTLTFIGNNNGAALTVGDEDRLRQVVWNLVSNAVKFTPRGGEVRVEVRRSESSFLLEVKDNGVGIDPEFLPYIFERFRQADATASRRYGGLGLGLSIVNHIVGQHGGEVSAYSEGKNTGTSFTVRLPTAAVLSPQKDAEQDPNREVKTAFRAPKDALTGLQILVVEDEKDAREVVGATLERYGARVQCAVSVADALALLDNFLPDLLISDIGMPGEDGYSLIQKVRARSPETGGRVPAIALTAYARDEDRAKALSSGFQNHLAKPVVPAELVVTLAALAGRMGATIQ